MLGAKLAEQKGKSKMWSYAELIAAVNNLNATVDNIGHLILYAVVFFGLLNFGRSLLRGGKSL